MGKERHNFSTLVLTCWRADGRRRFSIVSVMRSATWIISSSFIPRDVIIGVPIRIPLVVLAERESNGIVFLLTIIPAKLDSKRLTKKNIRDLNGKPLFLHSIDYAKNTIHENRIVVSSESKEVEELVPEDILFHQRSKDLCGDVEVVDVYFDIIEQIR